MKNEEIRIKIAQQKGCLPFDPDRCPVCGFPYSDEHCRPGDCSMRPPPRLRADESYPNWPENITDAWELFEEMRRLIGHVSLNSSVNNDTDKWYLLSNPKIPCFGYDHVVEDTAPRVISLAWLAWDAARKEDK